MHTEEHTMNDKRNTLQDRLDVLSEQIRGFQLNGERVPPELLQEEAKILSKLNKLLKSV